MLNIENLHSYYGNIEALKGISLQVAEGEVVTLIGANGAGKSTTLMSICGLVPPRQGTISFQGEPIQGLAPHRIVARGIIQAPEGRRIFPHLTVLENLEMGAFLRREKAGIRSDLDDLLSLFPILAQRRRQPGGTLSGGEQQMLAIARALMGRPRLLLLDEPSLGLAPLVVRRIFDTIAAINRDKRTTILLVEQNANLALSVAHRGYVLENGRITLTAGAADLIADERVRRAYLGI